MALNQNNRFNRYLSVGGETVYNYTFGIFESEDLQVQRLRDQEVTTLVQGAGNDYIVTDVNNPAGGTIVLNEAAEADDIYAIYGINEYRENTYSQNTGFRAADANRDMDQSIMIGQQNRRDIDQSIRAPLVDGPVDFTLPPKEERADKILKFGEDGEIELDDGYPITTDETVTEDGLTVVWDGTDGRKIRTAREYIQAPIGTTDSRPAPVAGMIRYNTDLLQLEAYDGITWVNVLTSGTGAPIQSTYIVQRPDGVLTDEQALSELDTGIMKSTTGTGVVSIAEAGVDYYGPGSAPGTDRDVYFNDDGDLNTTSSISIGVEGSVNINPEEGDVTISPEDGEVLISSIGENKNININSDAGSVNVRASETSTISTTGVGADLTLETVDGEITIQPQGDGKRLILASDGLIEISTPSGIIMATVGAASNIHLTPLDGNVVLDPINGDVVIHDLKYPKVDGTPGQVISTDGSNNLTFIDGGQSPGGIDGQFQYNDNGSFAGADSLTIANGKITMDPNAGVDITPQGPVKIETTSEDQEIEIKTFESNIEISATGLGADVQVTTGEGNINLSASGALNLTTEGLLNDVNITPESGDININAPVGDVKIWKTDPGSGVFINGLEYPDADGTTGQVIGTDGSGKLTFVNNTAGSNIFETIQVPGEDDIVAFGPNDTLNIQAGNNVTLETDSDTKTLTINSTGGGGGTPGGSGTQIQYRVDDNTFGGVSGTSFSGNNITLNPSGEVIIKGNTYPSNTGSNGQVMTTNGSGILSWADGGGGLPPGKDGGANINPMPDIIPNYEIELFGSLGGSQKWVGGVLAPNGKVYGIPDGSTQVLEIDPSNNTTQLFGSLGGSQKWVGGVLAPNGKIYGIPYGSSSVLEIDPSNNTTQLFGSLSTNLKGGVLAPNGKIYGIPYGSSSVLEIDPSNNTTQIFGSLSSNSRKWAGGVLAPNGKIYGIPSLSSSVLEIDPDTQTTQLFGNLIGSDKWWSGVLAPNGKIYGIPYNSTQVLEIDPSNNTTQLFGSLSGSAKWIGGVLAPNGKIYGIPHYSSSVLEIDPDTRTTQLFGNLVGNAKWAGGVLAPNGKIYGIPNLSSSVLEIDPLSPYALTWELSPYVNKY